MTWRDRAACADHDPELWFSHDNRDQDRALTICHHHCPVRDACLTYAIIHGERHGIWGGYRIDEITQLRRKVRRRLTDRIPA